MSTVNHVASLAWSSIRWRTNKGAHEATISEDIGKSKVSDLDVAIRVQEKVFELQIPMYYADLVAVVKS